LPVLRATDTRTIEAGQLLWRVYRTAGDHPVAWGDFRYHGPVRTGRFDHQSPPPHDDPDRGILYAAVDITAAVSEAFQDTRTIDRIRQEPWLVGFELTLDLIALDLTGLWPTRAGASQAIATGRRDIAQAWSRSVYDAYPGVGALLYRSSMASGSFDLALYERAAVHLPFNPRFHAPLTHPGLALPLQREAARLGYSLR
jgi:hypothetical protein